MTKRQALIKEIRAQARKSGVPFSSSQGGNHELLHLGDQVIPIPRHNEIRENTALRIRKECEEKLGKDWWK
ncbi:hypothetical protein [Bifidobacterium sp. ESL0745]|uniref:hypothetical protein n=1 Tax=Bifidobacterium sp. ESL0745 TaxID=2983226 RepID=UPI0023F6D161|nr:hypothetical protein [Bifidobacterium sp. ESL0745]MDF7664888.1 hypothetical protein [Bifidobacterium sp. ESL0745]